jgi:CPA2 family monovalent cation:H+ antiporter-2
VVLALGTASASAVLGLSPALGAFMGGLMLTETEFDHRVIAEMIPMRDLFATLFFVSVGMQIDGGFIVRHLPAVIGLACFIAIAKAACTALALAPFRLGSKTTAFAALGMISIGEFNYVLARVGLDGGAIEKDLYNLVLSSSLLTIVLTPAAFYFAPRLCCMLARVPALEPMFISEVELEAKQAILENHAVVVGYGRVGQRMVRGLRQAGLAVVVIEQDLNLVREVAAGGLATVYGDASYENVLRAAHPATARVVVVALPDFGATRAVVHRARLANPDVVIVARAQRTENDVMLREAGATAVVVPEVAGSLMLLEQTLVLLGMTYDHIFRGLPNLPAAGKAEATQQGATAGRDAAAEPVAIEQATPAAS